MAWSDLDLATGWTSGDAAYGPPQWQLEDAVVTLRGAVAPSARPGTDAVMIPAAVAPTTIVEWAAVGVGANGESIAAGVAMWPTGRARVWYQGGLPTKGIMLTGSYRID